MLVTTMPRALRRGALLVPDCGLTESCARASAPPESEGATRRPAGRCASDEPCRRRGPPAVRSDACAVGAVEAALAHRGQLGRNLTHPSERHARRALRRGGAGLAGRSPGVQVSEFIGRRMIVTAGSLPPALVACEPPRARRRARRADARLQPDGGGRVPRRGHRRRQGEDGRRRRARARSTTSPSAMPSSRARTSRSAERCTPPGAHRGLPSREQAGRWTPTQRGGFCVGSYAAMPSALHRARDGDRSYERRPARGVVSSFGEHHDVERLFVADASVLPGPVGVNPMETIVALAARSAEDLS